MNKNFHCLHKIEDQSIKSNKVFSIIPTIEGPYIGHTYSVCDTCCDKYVVGKPDSFHRDNKGWAIQGN